MSEQVLKLYKSSIVSCQMIMENGKYIYFKNSRYATCDEAEIEYLDKEIKAKHPHIFVDSNESSITAAVHNDPLAEIKKKAVEEYLKSLEPKDMGTSDKSAGAGAGMTTSDKLATMKK